MSIHSSFKSSDTMKRHRSVLSRLERIRLLQERGLLDIENGSVFGMPKVKHHKLRVKKEKTAAEPGAAPAATAGAGGAAAPAAAAGAKPAGKPAAGAAKPEAAAPAAKKKG